MARTMAVKRTGFAPIRSASLPHAGAATAADKKNSNNKPPSYPGASKRLSTKNKKRVELTATGAAFTKAIKSNRRASGSARTARTPIEGVTPCPPHSPRIARIAASDSTQNPTAKPAKGAPIMLPKTTGAIAAIHTPISAPVSRQRASCKCPCRPSNPALVTPCA